jgi:hypothetical protein
MILIVVCVILVMSSLQNLQCIVREPQLGSTFKVMHNNNNNNNHLLDIPSSSFSTISSSFDQTISIAQGLIDRALPPPRTPPPPAAQSNTSNTTTVTTLDLTQWKSRTLGGLQELDRIKLIELYSNVDSVFEYGLGESTYLANAVNVRRYVGVDSDAKWVAQARDQVSETYRFYFADIGPTMAWGYPKDVQHIPSKSVYQYQIMPLMAEREAFDIYMSDGRWRIPCMMASFLHASARGANTNHTIVLLHDCFRTQYWNNATGPMPTNRLRKSYFMADHLLDLMDHSGDRLCVYKRKPQTTDDDLLQFWQEHSNLLD